MGTTKVRTIRVDDENWEWLESQDGSINDTLTVLRKGVQTRNKLDEILELVRSQAAKIDDLHERQHKEPALSARDLALRHTEYGERGAIEDNRPKNATCKHCGKSFAGPRYATICPECKSKGHTNTPAECPPCLEANPT